MSDMIRPCSGDVHRTVPLLATALTLAASLMASTTGAAAADRPDVRLDHDPAAGTVDVHVRGEWFTTYHYGEFDPDGERATPSRTPILWPVKGEGGVGLTRNFPMGEDAVEDTDHPHQRSLFFVFGDVNGYDQWHTESIVTRKVETGAADGYAWIRAHHDWMDDQGEPILREVQELRFNDHPASGRRIDLISTFKAKYGRVTFGDDKEGMIALRIRPEINGRADGVLTNARGEQGESDVYGTPAPWMSYAGPLEDHGWRGIAIFDHPDNFRPGYWHARDYGLLSLNPFAKHDVGGLDEDGSRELGKGDTLTLRYAWYVHSGDHEEADIAGAHQRFVAETRAPEVAADHEEPIRALLVTGGAWHDFPTQTPIITEGLGERLNIVWEIENEAGDRPDFFPTRFEGEDWIEGFDLVVYNFSYSRIDVEDQKVLTERIADAHRETGVPVVLIHGTMHFGREVEQWHDFTGVETRRHKDRRPREVRNLKPEHPATQAIDSTWTPEVVELYIVESLREGVTPLADSYDEESGNRHPVIWTHAYGDAPIFGTTLGHDNALVADPVFLDTLEAGIRWTMQQGGTR